VADDVDLRYFPRAIGTGRGYHYGGKGGIRAFALWRRRNILLTSRMHV
jgi:hypothetical protein